MTYVLNEKNRTQLTVERGSHSSSLGTLRTLIPLPVTPAWKAGKAVASSPSGSLLPGTLIASFTRDGRARRESYACVYLGHDQAQIHILSPDPDSPKGRWQREQVSLQLVSGVEPRLNGKTYHVIE